ncbi:PREDICTED: zinc finger BED domain-containing protein 1-like, partial [Amphimedon queenslandica]
MAESSVSATKHPSVLEHFIVPETLPPGDFKAKCRYCKPEKYIIASVKVTTNWWKHLKRSHPSKLKEEEDPQMTLDYLIKTPAKKYDPKNITQISGNDALIEFIAGDLIPLSVVDSTNFKKFIEILDPKYQVPSQKHLSNVLLKKKYSVVKNKVIEKVSKATTINLAIDLWSNRQMKSYLGITGHFISKQWELESVMLGCNRVIGRHTSDNILSWYEEVVAEFLLSTKVRHIVTDSGSNIRKAFCNLALPGFDLSVHADEEDDTDDENEDDSVSVSHSLESNVVLDHHACFAHVLQLVIKDGLAKIGHIGTILKKCSNLVSFVRKSTIATDVLIGEARLQASNITRWNSQLKMIRSILKVPDSKLAELEDAPILTAHDRNILNDMVEILTPFEEATDTVQISCIPSAGYILPCVRGLDHHMKGMILKYHSTFVQALKSSLRKRMAYYEEQEAYIVAAILDP